MKINFKNAINLLNVPQAEPYVIEKVNEKTGELEELHINPTSSGLIKYTLPVYM